MVVRRLPYPLSPHSDKTVVLSVQSGLASRLSDVSALHAGMRFEYLLYTFYGGFSNQLLHLFIYYIIYSKKLHKYQHALSWKTTDITLDLNTYYISAH